MAGITPFKARRSRLPAGLICLLREPTLTTPKDPRRRLRGTSFARVDSAPGLVSVTFLRNQVDGGLGANQLPVAAIQVGAVIARLTGTIERLPVPDLAVEDPDHSGVANRDEEVAGAPAENFFSPAWAEDDAEGPWSHARPARQQRATPEGDPPSPSRRSDDLVMDEDSLGQRQAQYFRHLSREEREGSGRRACIYGRAVCNVGEKAIFVRRRNSRHQAPTPDTIVSAKFRTPRRLQKRNMTGITSETLVRDFDRQLKVSDQDLAAMSLQDFRAWMATMINGIACLAMDCIRRWIGEWKRVRTWIRDLNDQEKVIRKKNFRYIAQCLQNGDWVLDRKESHERWRRNAQLRRLARAKYGDAGSSPSRLALWKQQLLDLPTGGQMTLNEFPSGIENPHHQLHPL
ncbi:hypothetical protein RHOSPDRAFT_24704 [Rhodotorula sp. JG-1b]|nr:hypothetical protein RHOSPDRAFT_24704 [Rhodotorula sp. JG-1b]